jgi:hypothetical protein
VFLNLLSAADKASEDVLYHHASDTKGEIRIIKIDDKTMNKLGDISTWDRSVYTKLLNTLCVSEEIRPAVVGFDILLSSEKDAETDKEFAETCKKYGNAVTSLPYNEQIFVVDDEISTVKYIPRETLRRVATPQAYKFGKLNWAYHEAFEKEIGIYGSSYTNTMMVELGERLYFAAGSDKNIKLTNKDDLEMFKAYLLSEKQNRLK